MIIKDVYMFKVPDFLICAIHYGDITDFTDEDEEILKTANNAFEALCLEDESYVVALPKSDQVAEFTANPDFTKEACNCYDLLVTVFK